VVGHEPTWSIAVGALTGGSDVRMPTAAAAAIEFDGAWSRVGVDNGLLLWLVNPRLLA
jgi:phosphohistidine phosphatase SixA